MIDKDWIDASFCFGRWVEPHIVSFDIQSLGDIEAILDAWEQQFTPIYHNQQTGDYDFNAPNDIANKKEVILKSHIIT